MSNVVGISANEFFAVSVWVGSLYAVVISWILTLFFLPHPIATASLAVLVALTLCPPLDVKPRWAEKMVSFACKTACEYFPAKVICESDTFKADQAYVIGYEPHSALPVGMPVVFCNASPALPAALKPMHGLATSAAFWCPVVKQLWWWLGIRPVTKASMHKLLAGGASICINPGGVQEILHMRHNCEVAFLRRRRGFVRIAMQHGAPLVPAFAFGQTQSYRFIKPGPPFLPAALVQYISRCIGFVPLLMFGQWGTPVPRKHAITIVLGAPIDVPRHDDPPVELVDEYLNKFIASMQHTFEKHKAALGCSNVELKIL